MAITKTYTCDRCGKTSEPRIDIFYMDNVEYKETTYPKEWAFVELDPPTVEKSVKVLLCDNCSKKFRDVMINFLLSKEEESPKMEEQVKPTAATRQKNPKDDDISTYQEHSYMRHPDRVEMRTY